MTAALLVAASRCTSLIFALPRCRWLVGHPRSVRREYTRRLPIDNLECRRHDVEYGRRRSNQFAVSFDADRFVGVDLDVPGPGELHFAEPPVRPAVEQGQADDALQSADVRDRDDLEDPV